MNRANPVIFMHRKIGMPQPGQWITTDQRTPSQTQLGCPKCGEHVSLKGFRIRRTGEVDPALQCQCGFTEWIKLGEWAPPRGR